MPFPKSERVLYKKNPLIQVICQLRFPAILRIDTVAPSEFHDKIRDQYPLYQHRVESLSLPPELLAQLAQSQPDIAKSILNAKPTTVHEFISSDKICALNLSKEAILL